MNIVYYKVYSAGLPNSCPVTKSCTYNRSTCTLEVDLGIPTITNTDLDHVIIELFNFSELINHVKLPAVASSNVSTSFPLVIRNSSLNDIYINVTAFDKCGQSSPQPSTVHCTGI